MTTQRYSANGKLLLTGEYLVLHGALALALPAQLGQTMTVEEGPASSLQWDAYTPKGRWFSASLNLDTLEVVQSDDLAKAQKLASILKVVRMMNPDTFSQGLHFITRLGFDPSWGLGSSSTLLSLLAQWAGVDPYALLKKTIGGSGYDIACATAQAPVFYRVEMDRPVCSNAYFAPLFHKQLFFVYLGKKQHSSKEVADFNQRWLQHDFHADVMKVSEISRSLPSVKTLDEFRNYIDLHENILAHCLERQPVRASFPGFEGSLKSLGAWGGDFMMAATPWSAEQVKAYFHDFGLEVIFNYNDLISNHITDNTVYETRLDQRSI